MVARDAAGMTATGATAATVGPRATVVIVGAGFSGTVLAVQLLRLAAGRPLRIVLVNPTAAMGRGLAYGTRSALHLLNVPAGNMSALADEPDHFLAHARAADPGVQAHSFLPRNLYGAYLEQLLAQHEQALPASCVLERRVAEVMYLDPPAPAPTSTSASASASAPPSRARLRLSDGSQLEADHVVLATGHLPPADPPAVAGAVSGAISGAMSGAMSGNPRYVSDPWSPGALDRLPPGPVLLLGTGLTALDVTLSLHALTPARPVLCLSRRGLLSAAHREQRSLPPGADAAGAAAALAAGLAAGLGRGVRADLRAVRLAVARHVAAGGDWRDMIAALRPHTPAWWQRTPWPERRRFVQRLQPYWDTARHRCAPVPHAVFAAARAAGSVRVAGGRLVDLQEVSGGLQARWLPRGGGALQCRVYAGVVNCTGPSTDLGRHGSPLVRQLLGAGWLSVDPLGLGLQVDAHGTVIGAQGHPTPGLHCLGPLLRARDWEATAVPELRVQAQHLAQRLWSEVGRRVG